MNALAPIPEDITSERVPPMGVRWHPYADLFPWIEGAAFDELKADIAANGIREPIVFYEDQVLDGRNRYMAARDLGIDYPRVEYQGDDPLGFVVSLNLKRRHMSERERAMVASRLANMPQGARTDIAPIGAMSDAAAAKMLNVSERSVERAKAVRRDGAPTLVVAVETGDVSLSAAAEVAKLPVAEQKTIVEAGPVAVKEVAKVVRETGADPDKAALRASVTEAAKQGLSPERKDRRNKQYEDDPAYRMLMRIVGPCSTMIEQVGRGEIVIADALTGFLDDVPGHRDRALRQVAHARDYLSQFLEAANAH